MTMTNSETINIMDCEAGRIFNGEQIRRKNAIKSGVKLDTTLRESEA